MADPEDEAAILPQLVRAGYELRVREPGHRMLRTPTRDVHLHVWQTSSPEIERVLRFRDRLRASPQARSAYARLKRELATVDWEDMNYYADAKSDLIAAILAEA